MADAGSERHCRLVVAQTTEPGEQGVPRDPFDTIKLRGKFCWGRDVWERVRSHFGYDPVKLEIWDEATGFVQLEADTDVRAMTAARVLVHVPQATAATHTTLAIEGRAFNDSDLRIAGKPLALRGIPNSGAGTGHNTWDGAVVLAKFLELHPSIVEGKAVLELGAGTGLTGIAAAMLGASEVLLTDLPYVMENLRQNIASNSVSNAEAAELDWMKIAEYEHITKQRRWDVVLCADVVWLEQLVLPLVRTLQAIGQEGEARPRILMSYQKRSNFVHEALMGELAARGCSVTQIDAADYHPEYSSPKIAIYEMRMP